MTEDRKGPTLVERRESGREVQRRRRGEEGGQMGQCWT